METLFVNKVPYNVHGMIGKGKGGYSFLVEKDGVKYVLKQIHHEPCDFYQFGNKIKAEIDDYHRMENLGIRMPMLYDHDLRNERILKEYIEGSTIFDLVLHDKMKDTYFDQIKEMCKNAYAENINIDYFPTNFIVRDDVLYYVDYECNVYKEDWNFENWGVKYWSKTEEFMEYARTRS